MTDSVDQHYYSRPPESVEEAAALLGATITRCGRERIPSVSPPKGLPSVFASVQPAVPSADLLMRLHDLRRFLRDALKEEDPNRAPTSSTSTPAASSSTARPPLAAAPSILAVLMKLLPVSTSIAARGPTPAPARGVAPSAQGCSLDTPPMLSIPLRALWSDCVALCHVLGKGLTGPSHMDPLAFVRSFLALAATNPKSARAAGGVRIAALQAMRQLYSQSELVGDLAPWALEVLQQGCLRALKSAGQGEPAYRTEAVRLACAIAAACRESHLQRKRRSAALSSSFSVEESWALPGAMDDPALLEAIKVVKQGSADPVPHVRRAASELASILAPLAVHRSTIDLPHPQHLLHGLDELLKTSARNLDDEFPFVADGWADSLARAVLAAIEYHRQRDSDRAASVAASASPSSPSDRGDDGPTAGAAAATRTTSTGTGMALPKPAGSWAHAHCTSVSSALQWLVESFVKVGGELTAAKGGGSYSLGGRAIRVGWSLALYKLVRLHTVHGGKGGSDGTTDGGPTNRVIVELVLQMLGDDVEKQLKAPLHSEATAAAASPLFGVGAARVRSKGDAGLIRGAANRILRQGISEVASEPVQLALLKDLVTLITASSQPPATATSNTTSSPSRASSLASPVEALNANQLQVLLVEVSALLVALDEAAASAVEDAVAALHSCLEHKDHGVRHEAAIACAALSSSFPTEGRKMLRRSLNEVQSHHAELVTASMNPSAKSKDSAALSAAATSGLRMFRRAAAPEKAPTDLSLAHQFAIHGWGLAASLLLKDLPRLPGGLPTEVMSMALSVAEILISFQFNEELSAANPGAVCLCVRSGFAMVSGILATGPNLGVSSNLAVVFGAWQRTCLSAKTGGNKHFAPRHDLFCLDGMLASVVAFLKYCSELLLSVPEALSQVTAILEDSLLLLSPQGRLNAVAMTPPVAARMESAKAALLEAYAWLPSGSFPLAADGVFGLAAACIREAIEGDVTCSILQSLVSREDEILDAKNACAAQRLGQLGGARDLEETIALLTAEAVVHSEREAVIHLQPWLEVETMDETERELSESAILGVYAADTGSDKAPTPLHGIGSWRKPLDPSQSSKIRLVDAAIQAFAATFGLKSGKEQHIAMTMLESLVPPLLAQLARSLGAKEDSAAVANIISVILCCLKSIPQYESTHNIPLSLGPQWMNMAKDLLLTILPSVSFLVRRAAAEGLALLATLGVTEDAHFMQSTVLHSLDELMIGNKPDGKPRTLALEPISAARSGSLLTLASIQRTSHKMAEKQLDKARERAKSYGDDEVVAAKEDDLPLLQMLTRIMPSVSFHGVFRDYFIVRVSALHSFALLLSYSSKIDSSKPDEVAMQLLRKCIEVIEGSFCAAWTSATGDFDRGLDGDKMACEVSLVTVLLRMMTHSVPHLRHMLIEHPDIGRRFAAMSALALEIHSSHPAVYVEAMAFFEVLARHREVLPSRSTHMNIEENPLHSSVPFLVRNELRPVRLARGCAEKDTFPLLSTRCFRAATRTALSVTMGQLHLTLSMDMRIVAGLLSYLEIACASRLFLGSTLLRSLAAGRGVELVFADGMALEKEVLDAIPALLLLEHGFLRNCSDMYCRWLLLLRAVLTWTPGPDASGDPETQGPSVAVAKHLANVRATNEVSLLFEVSSVPRWQVKALAAELSSVALDAVLQSSDPGELDRKRDPNLNYNEAVAQFNKACRDAQHSSRPQPSSKIVFHLDELVAAACMMSVATLDHSELRSVQGYALLLLDRIIVAFGKVPDPQEPESSILDQYSTQIFSSVKHALSALDDNGCENVLRLFATGCACLESIVKVALTTDPIVLKRLIRPTIPSSTDMPLFKPADRPDRSQSNNHSSIVLTDTRAAPFLQICQLASTAKLFTHINGPSMESTLSKIKLELMPEELSLAVHAAAAALDGASILQRKATVEGNREGGRGVHRAESGYFYDNLSDVADSVQALLIQSWSDCASFSLGPLLSTFGLSESDESTRNLCWSWIELIVALLLNGVDDADEALQRAHVKGSRQVHDVSESTCTMVKCLRGLEPLVRLCPASSLKDVWIKRMEGALDRLRVSVIMPALEIDFGDLPEPCVVSACCSFLLQFVERRCSNIGNDSSLLVTLLHILDLIQTRRPDFQTRRGAGLIASTSLAALGRLVSASPTAFPDGLIYSLTDLVLQSFLLPSSSSAHPLSEAIPASVAEGAELLLSHCLHHPSMANHTSGLALRLAQESSWPAWGVVVSLDATDTSIAETSTVVIASLTSADTQQCILDVLATLVRVLSNKACRPSLASFVIVNFGGEVLQLLASCGAPTSDLPAFSPEVRKAIFADALRLLLIGYQHLTAWQESSHSSEDMALYLLLLWEVLITVLRFNGLPNHPTPSGDVTLGRMVSQAITTVARTTPQAFKLGVGRLSEVDRALVEFAVRGELSGYAVATAAAPSHEPLKRKLNVASFKR